MERSHRQVWQTHRRIQNLYYCERISSGLLNQRKETDEDRLQDSKWHQTNTKIDFTQRNTWNGSQVSSSLGKLLSRRTSLRCSAWKRKIHSDLPWNDSYLRGRSLPSRPGVGKFQSCLWDQPQDPLSFTRIIPWGEYKLQHPLRQANKARVFS